MHQAYKCGAFQTMNAVQKHRKLEKIIKHILSTTMAANILNF